MTIAATIKDVAAATGLSIATISKYINGGSVKERNRLAIEKAILDLGFKVNAFAQGLKTNRTRTVGVLIPNLEQTFCTRIVSYIEDTLLRQGYSTLVCDYRNDTVQEDARMGFLIDRMVDGLIVMPSGKNNASMHDRMAESGIPFVLIDRPDPSGNCDAVLVDNLNAAYGAVEALITRGHRRIGLIGGPDDVFTAQERKKGYLRVFEDYHLSVDPQLLCTGAYDVESGLRIIRELLSLPHPPTAVFATNYEMTLGMIMALNEDGIRIPEQLSVIGFDNLMLSELVRPRLSVVVQPMKEIGETAATLLLKRLSGDETSEPALFRLKTELLIRESVNEISR